MLWPVDKKKKDFLTGWTVFSPVLLHLFEFIVKWEAAALATFLNRTWPYGWWGEEVVLHL